VLVGVVTGVTGAIGVAVGVVGVTVCVTVGVIVDGVVGTGVGNGVGEGVTVGVFCAPPCVPVVGVVVLRATGDAPCEVDVSGVGCCTIVFVYVVAFTFTCAFGVVQEDALLDGVGVT